MCRRPRTPTSGWVLCAVSDLQRLRPQETMMKLQRSLCSLLVLVSVMTIGTPSTAWAALSSCTIGTVIPVAFGTYNVFATTALTVNGSIAVSCGGNGIVAVTVDRFRNGCSFARGS